MDIEKPKLSVRNTAKEAQRNPELKLMEMLAFGTTNAIEAEEKTGQSNFCHSDVLPTEIQKPSTKSMFEDLGFKFGDVVKDDPMFTCAQLPDGWKKEATDHSIWSNIVDDKGRARVGIFYKAAFYDRSAFMSLSSAVTTNTCERHVEAERENNRHQLEVLICGEVKFTTKLYKGADSYSDAGDEAAEWISANYPDRRNPLAYWEEK